MKGKGKEKEDEPAPAVAEAPAPTSAFDFLSPPAPAPATSPSSGFSFIGGAPAPAPEHTEAETPAPSSAFSFLASTSPPAPAAAASTTPPPPAAPAASDTSSVPDADLLSAGSSIPSAVGSGVVFGGATAAKPKKKRNRTNKIGAGATAPPAAPSAPATAPPRPAVPTPPPPEDTRSKSLEAAQRAEAMMQKLAQQGAPANTTNTASASSVGSGSLKLSHDNSGLHHPPTIQKAPSLDRDDEDVAAALKAAEEAQQMAAKPHRSHFSLGGLFRSSGSAATSNAPSISNQRTASSNSMHSQKSTDSGRGKATAAAKSENNKHAEETMVEKMKREQEEAQRAIAERELNRRKEDAERREFVTAAPVAAVEKPTYGEVQEPSRADETYTSLETPSYGESKPVESISIPEPAVKTSASSSAFGALGGKPKLSMSSNFSFMTKPSEPVVKKKPLPPKRDTATDVFVAMMREFNNEVSVSMAEVQRLRQHKSGLLEERFQTVAKQRLAAQQKAAAESQQMAAAEAEDYELADRLTTLLATHEREEKECASVLENIGRALEELEQQKNGLVKGITESFEGMQKKLSKFQAEQMSKEEEDVTEVLKRFESTSKQLSAENDRLEGEWKSIERDERLAKEEHEDLEKKISEQAGVYEKLRDEAREKVATLEEEIEELRRQLAEKQKMVAQYRNDAAGHDEEVLKVRVKFNRQLNRIQTKEMSLQHTREDWEREKQAFEAQKEEHEAEVAAHSEALAARDKLKENLKTEVEMAETFGELIGQEIGFEVANNEESPDEELAGLQANVVKCEAALSEAKEVLQSAASGLAALETEVKNLEARIPMLEDMKKAAAAKRDFKAAAQARKDTTVAEARLQECRAEIAHTALDRKNVAEAECKRLEEDLAQAKSLALEKEKDAGKATMQRLADHMKRLLATKESVCMNATEDSIQAVGALVLDAQIEALEFEGKTYGEKYGGWDELVGDLGLSKAKPTALPSKDVESNEGESLTEQDHAEKAEEVDTVPAAPVQPLSSEDRTAALAEFRELSRRMTELDVTIQKLAEAEEFDKAAELDEEMNSLLEQVAALGLSEDEMAAEMQSSDNGQPATEAEEETHPHMDGDPDTDATPEAADPITSDTELEGVKEAESSGDAVVADADQIPNDSEVAVSTYENCDEYPDTVDEKADAIGNGEGKESSLAPNPGDEDENL